MTRNYWWPGVTKDVGKYVDGCGICQRIKNYIEVLVENLIANKILERLWTHLMIDFITKLPLVAGKDVILVFCNRLSKIAYFMATTKGILAEWLA